MKKSDIIIIGGGLTGLTLAYLLRTKNVKVKIIEARERLGGRIFTKYNVGQAPQEMGATWLGKKHRALIKLLNELGVEIFEQVLGDRAIYEAISTSPPQLVHLPPNTEPSYRIQGGTSKLIHILTERLNTDDIFLGKVVKSIEKEGKEIRVKTAQNEFEASYVISTLPPYLLTSTIQCSPELPADLLRIAKQTHTWMGESIKVSLSYAEPFWRAENRSGTIVSNVGPIPEMYDHSNVEDTSYALKGFFNGAYFSVSKEERLALVLRQLEKYFGAVARDFIAYEETVWRKETYTFIPYPSHVLPHQNNGHSVYQKAYWNGQLYLAGTETATDFPGYMEGAVRSALSVFQQLDTLVINANQG